MKKLIYLFFLFLIPYTILLPQNSWLLKNCGSFNISISFIDEYTGWVGSSDRFCKTTDGANNWVLDNYLIFPYRICFPDSYTGFCGNSNSIIKTTNKGVNWNTVTTGFEPYSVSDIFFINNQTGWIASADNNKIIKTTNGGNNWIQSLDIPCSPKAIFFINDNTGWACGNRWSIYNAIVKTTNGGVNWFSQYIDSTNLTHESICFINFTTGFCTSQSKLYKSTNEGTTWNLFMTFSNSSIYKIKFLNSSTGYLCCFNYLKRTTDGGNTFTDCVTGNSFYDISIINSNIAFATGSDGHVYKTMNGGVNWTAYISTLSSWGNFTSISYINQNTLFVDNIKTIDRGDTWVNPAGNGLSNILCVNFINENTGFVVKRNGAMSYQWNELYKTTNTGLNWMLKLTTAAEYVPFTFNGFTFINSSTGWAYGSSGNIYKTNNCGDNWSLLTSVSTNNYRTMKFINDLTGFCTAGGGNLIKTTNGGLNWFIFPTGASGNLYGLYFINQNTGWFTLENGQIYKSTNGGQNWFSQNAALDKILYNIYFTDSLYGWACGQNGIILKTLNSGTLWRTDMNNLGSNLYNVYFFDRNTGICTGGGSTIIKTTTGGMTWLKYENNVFPVKFYLSQNYPNPFNPVTTIKFDIPSLKEKTGYVRLDVYDLLGKKISSLVNENLTSGSYSVNFDASSLATGAYIYRLSVNNEVIATKKMVLIK